LPKRYLKKRLEKFFEKIFLKQQLEVFEKNSWKKARATVECKKKTLCKKNAINW